MKLSLIICTKNRASQLDLCLKHLNELRGGGLEFEIIVVDNNSSDSTSEVIQGFKNISRYPFISCFSSKVGLGAARNCGVQESSGNILAFTDDDCYLDENYILALDQHFSSSGAEYGMGQILLYDNADDDRVANCIIKEKRILPKNINILPAGLIQGANMFCDKGLFHKAGLFNEDMGAGTDFPCEDIEWACRASNSGAVGVLLPQVIVYHHHMKKKGSIEALSTVHAYDFGRGAYYASLMARGVPNVWDFWRDASMSGNHIASIGHLDRISRELDGASKYFKFISGKYFNE